MPFSGGILSVISAFRCYILDHGLWDIMVFIILDRKTHFVKHGLPIWQLITL